MVMPCDLADRAALDRLTDDLLALDAVDGLVANAALPATGQVEDYTTAELDRALDVNLRAPMVLTQRLVPGMLERGRGHFVYVSSMGGKMGTSRLSVYATTKFGLRGFGASLRQDLAGSGVSARWSSPARSSTAACSPMRAVGASPGTKGSTCAEVGAGVVKAITADVGELDVAHVMVRTAAKVHGGGAGPERPDAATRGWLPTRNRSPTACATSAEPAPEPEPVSAQPSGVTSR